MRALRGIKLDPTAIGWDLVQLLPKGLQLGKADVKFEMSNGVLLITPSNVPANGGTVVVLGKVDFNADPPAFIVEKQPLGGSIGLNRQITASWLGWLPLNWGAKPGQVAEAGGQVKILITEAYIPLEFEKYKHKATLVGTINIENLSAEAPFLAEVARSLGPVLKLQPDLFTIRGGSIPEIPFALRDGKVSYQNLRLGTGKSNLTFSGSVGLDTSLAMNMQVTSNNVTLPVPVVLKGTTANPEVVFDLKALGNPQDLGKTLEKAAPGLINDLLKQGQKKK
jgi:hypothetical protein